MYSRHNTAVFIVVARAASGLRVLTLRRPQDGRKWSAGKSKDMSAHQREGAQNGGFSPGSVYSTISKSSYAAHHRFTWPFPADWVLKNIVLVTDRRLDSDFIVPYLTHCLLVSWLILPNKIRKLTGAPKRTVR